MLLVIVSGLALGGLYGMTALIYNVMTSKVLSFGTGSRFHALAAVVVVSTIRCGECWA